MPAGGDPRQLRGGSCTMSAEGHRSRTNKKSQLRTLLQSQTRWPSVFSLENGAGIAFRGST